MQPSHFNLIAAPRLGWPALIVLLVSLDQWLKFAIEDFLPLYASVTITSWFNLVHVLNPGAAFSFLADAGGWQRYFFTFVGLAIGCGIVIMLFLSKIASSERLPFALIAAGGLANVCDRIRLGAVVDYLDLHVGLWHWPAFNAADTFVVLGAALLIRTEMSGTKIKGP